MLKTCGIAVVLLAAGAAQATSVAQFTPINGGGFTGSYDGSNQGLAYVLARSYGAGTVLSTAAGRTDSRGQAIDFHGTTTVGGYTLNFTRVADFYLTDGSYDAGGAFNIRTYNHDGASDQVFQDGTAPVRGRILYSGAAQQVGFNNGSNNVLWNLPAQLNTNVDSAFHDVFFGPTPTLFTFFRNSQVSNAAANQVVTNGQGGNVLDRAGNSFTRDTFVSYVLTSNEPGFAPRLVLAIDDSLGGGTDRDFQDFVFEVSLVPNPLAAHGALAGLAGMGVLGLRRRRA